jgi:hypothetical protein
MPCAKPFGPTGIIFRVLTFSVRLCCAIVFLTVNAIAWLLAIRAKITESKRYTNNRQLLLHFVVCRSGGACNKNASKPRLSVYFSITKDRHRYIMVFITINELRLNNVEDL